VSRAPDARDTRPGRRARPGLALLSILALAGCGIYTLGGPGHGDRFVVPPGAATNPDAVVQSWVAYSLARSTCQLEHGGDAPSHHRSFECELGPREVLVERWAGRDARRNPDAEGAPAPPPQQDEYLDLLVRVRDAGFLAEYVWHYLREPGWKEPEGLRHSAFEAWRAREGLRWHRPRTRIIGYWMRTRG